MFVLSWGGVFVFEATIINYFLGGRVGVVVIAVVFGGFSL